MFSYSSKMIVDIRYILSIWNRKIWLLEYTNLPFLVKKNSKFSIFPVKLYTSIFMKFWKIQHQILITFSVVTKTALLSNTLNNSVQNKTKKVNMRRKLTKFTLYIAFRIDIHKKFHILQILGVFWRFKTKFTAYANSKHLHILHAIQLNTIIIFKTVLNFSHHLKINIKRCNFKS